MNLFLTNRAVNLLAVHYGLHSLAVRMVDVFFGIYLYQAGVPLWQIFCIWGAIFLFRLVLRPFLMQIPYRYGLRTSIMLGVLCYSASFLILSQAKGVDFWLLIFIFLCVLTDIFYWLPYHVYFALLGDLVHRGKQVAVRETAVLLIGLVAPIFSASLITIFSFSAVFWSAAGVMLAAMLPLCFTPEIFPKKPQKILSALKKTSKSGFWLYVADGIFNSATIGFTWNMVLFLFLRDYISFGGLLSLAVLFQVIGTLLIGHQFDRGNGAKLHLIGFLLVGLTTIGRVFFLNSIPAIIFFDVLFMLGVIIYFPIYQGAFYNAVKNSSDPFLFQFWAESGWDVGSILVSAFAAIYLYFGGELRFIMLFGLLGLAGLWFLLRRYFAQQIERF